MAMPIDIKAVLNELAGVEEARRQSLSVSVYLDDSAPNDLIGFVRNEFSSAAANARITIGYLDTLSVGSNTAMDAAVVVAGTDESVGKVCQDIRYAGTPVMVVTTLPTAVERIAKEQGFPIPAADLISPLSVLQPETSRAARVAQDVVDSGTIPDAAISAAKGIGSTLKDLPGKFTLGGDDGPLTMEELGEEPYVLNEKMISALRMRMGEWVIAACNAKRLAFAQAFSFVRKPLSQEAVSKTALENAAVGAALFIPGADMPVMTLNQAKMLIQIAAAYGQTLGTERVKELAALVGGGFTFRAVARNLVGLVPGLGWAIKGTIGYTGTVIMGRATIEYFESGGGIAGLGELVGRAQKVAFKAVMKAGEIKDQYQDFKAEHQPQKDGE